MAAPDLETLLDFETNIESAAETFLATDTGLTAGSIFVSLDEDDLVLPRLGVMFELGEGLDPPTQKSASDATLAYSEYTGTLTVRIVTGASLDGANVDHRSYRSKVRKSLLINAANFSTEALVVTGAGIDAANGIYPKTGEDAQNRGIYIKKDSLGNQLFKIDQADPVSIFEYFYLLRDAEGGEMYESTNESVQGQVPETGWFANNASIYPDVGSAPSLVETLTILPYYDIKYLRPSGTTFEIEGDLAISTLTYEIRLGIRTDAWPT